MKKALSLLLAVLMLVSLFSGMAFADDVIAEEPADDVIAEEPAATDEFVGDDYVEEADAFVEEYTDEGSFEAADIVTMEEFEVMLREMGWTIERMDPANPKCGDLVDVWVHDGTQLLAKPRTVLYDHLWTPNGLPTPGYDADEVYDGVNGWKLTSSSEASCTEGGILTYERKCLRDGCTFKEEKEVELQRQNHVWATDPFTYAYWNGDDEGEDYTNLASYDPDFVLTMSKDDRAIKVMPTVTKSGVGHEVCLICGRENPMTKDYPIDKHVNEGDNPYHPYSDWQVTVPATCSLDGYMEKVCNVLGCDGSVNKPYPEHADPNEKGFNHIDPETGESMLEFDHIERVSCWQYVEVWTCTNPLCCTKVNHTTGVITSTYPNACQYEEFRGVDGSVYLTWTDVKAAAETTLADYEDAEADLDDAVELYVDMLEEGFIDQEEFNTRLTEAYSVYDEAILEIAADDDLFCYVAEYDPDHNTEHYAHHRFSGDWVMVVKPACCVNGLMARMCEDCAFPSFYPVEALEPIYGTKVYTQTQRLGDGEYYDYHYVRCTRPECEAEEPEAWLGKLTRDPADERCFTQANNYNPQTLIVDHDWSDWIVELAPSEANRGHWYRTCMYKGCTAREDFFGTQEEFDEMISHPVLNTGIYPVLVDDGVIYVYYVMGLFQEDFTGIADTICEGVWGQYYVENGIWMNKEMGAKLVGETWYFLANGIVQEVTQLAEYCGEWFYVKDGIIDTTMNGLVDYNGGTFMLGAGRIQKEVSGLWENSKLIGGDGEWYYLANGQVQKDYTGLVQYDGEWFYVENGRLVPFNGEVEYDGEIFNVKNGMVVAA